MTKSDTSGYFFHFQNIYDNFPVICKTVKTPQKEKKISYIGHREISKGAFYYPLGSSTNVGLLGENDHESNSAMCKSSIA